MTDFLRRLEKWLAAFRSPGSRPTPREIDQVLNDGYAYVLELEASRSALSRDIAELAESAHEPWTTPSPETTAATA